MTTWDYTPTCRGFDYFYGYWNAAQDYYTHGGPHALDLHENFVPVTDKAGVCECSNGRIGLIDCCCDS